MQKIAAIFFLLIFSASVTEAGQLLKLPKLIQHYFVHSKKEGAGSFVDFLKEHYILNHKDDGDQKEDNRLPFKEINVACFSSVFVAVNFIDLKQSRPDIQLRHQHYIQPYMSADHLFGIFHPPRLS